MLLQTLGKLQIIGAATKKGDPYQGVQNLVLLCYLMDKGSQEREQLAALFWPQSKTPSNNLSKAMANLSKETGVDTPILQTIKGNGYTSSIEIHPSYCHSVAGEDRHELLADFLLCEDACRTSDLKTLQHYYQGMFLEGIEKHAAHLSDALRRWIEEKRSELADRVLETCLAVLQNDFQDSEAAQSERDCARALLEILLAHKSEALISTSLLADAYSHVSATHQAELSQHVLSALSADSQGGIVMPLLYTMALQTHPNWNVAYAAYYSQQSRRSDENTEDTAQKNTCLEYIYDEDWLHDTDTEEPQTSYRHKQQRLRGRSFWRSYLTPTPHLYLPLLKCLWRKTYAESFEQYEELFALAWSYYQGIDIQHAGVLSQGIGNLADLADSPSRWLKLTATFLHRMQQASREESFAEVQALCQIWEGLRQQKKASIDPEVRFYYAYSLERQGDYPSAELWLQDVWEASDRHRALWASLLLRRGDSEATSYAEQLLDKSSDSWACAEAHSLLAKVAYHAQEYDTGISHYACAATYWQQANEPRRALGAKVSIAACYDCKNDVARAKDAYQELQQAMKQHHTPTLTRLRIRLNELLLWDRCNLEPIQTIREGFTALIADLHKQPISYELLGKACYNFAYHYYEDYQRLSSKTPSSIALDQARSYYQQALEHLQKGHDSVTFTCAMAELGRVHCLQEDCVPGLALLHEAIKRFDAIQQASYAEEYRAVLTNCQCPQELR